MPSRFYYRPVDTGWGRFGATISQALGDAGRTYERGKVRETEEERYQQRIDREDEAIARRKAERLADIRRRYAERGMISPDQAYEEGTPQPGVGIYDSMGITPQDEGPDPRATSTQQLRPGVATVMDPEVGEVHIDPRQSLDFIRAEAEQERINQQRSKEREEILSIIQKAMDPDSPGGEEVTPEEMVKIRNYGGDVEPLQSLLLNKDRARYRTGRGDGGGTGITGNRAVDLAVQGAGGAANRLVQQGVSEDELLDHPEMRRYVATLGPDVLFDVVREALAGPRVSPSDRKAAEEYVAEQAFNDTEGVYPEQGTQEYMDLVADMARRIATMSATEYPTLVRPPAREPVEVDRGFLESVLNPGNPLDPLGIQSSGAPAWRVRAEELEAQGLEEDEILEILREERLIR